jgi:hypothetical protein
MPRFRIKVKNSHSEWWEEYCKNEVTDAASAKTWADKTLRAFNDGEQRIYGDKGKPRTLIAVDFLGDGPLDHEWEKQNSFTLGGDGHRYRDQYRCKRCGCQALRYGISEAIIRTGKWRAKKYEHCIGKV